MPAARGHLLAARTPIERQVDLGRVTASDFGVAQMQAILFTPDEEVSGVKLSRLLLPRWERLFDAEPFVLPAIGPAPREVPRLILQSQANDLRCEISSERITVLWQRASPTATFPADFPDQVAQLLNEYAHLLNARVGRLAAVLTRYVVHPEPGLYLARHFCQPRWYERPFNRPENFEIHAHKVFLMAKEFTVNSWVRSKTATIGGDADRRRAIAVEQDLNTLIEEAPSRAFDEREVHTYFNAAAGEFEQILEQYYPSTGDKE